MVSIQCPERHSTADSLDRDAYRTTVPVLGLKAPPSKIGKYLKEDVLKRSLLNVPRIASVAKLADGERLILLEVQSKEELPHDVQAFIASEGCDLVPHAINLDYSYWTADDILQSTLPESLCDGSPTGFTITGHLAHLNLRDEYLPYKKLIGQVILDKNPAIRTVVNKLDTIDNQFRFFKMELLAGEPDYIVEAHESDCRFTFDFSTVYWNSRLHTEHARLVSLFRPGEVVADVFAGVGPFAIPAAKKGSLVVANDLNPKSSEYLAVNVESNHVAERVRVSNEDGRTFVERVAEEVWQRPFPALGPLQSKREAKSRKRAGPTKEVSVDADNRVVRNISHFVMNLPDTAILFLDAFRGILKNISNDPAFAELYATMPMIHCHCFTRELEPAAAERDILERVEKVLGVRPSEALNFHLVRSVAPNKEMYCISFRLPKEIAH
ncbi:guanine-N(1)--methyltransferase [Sistotremastrum niveocremeum HHB9708]|uniref:tRNA (guanine(37)-N1)-methyltransferase n=2 Tax=Sistotremastraceae TaxID=3402574 RepID=A0A164UJU2_9AGAM|nr:guanine-N(1)--methyltransferase [Sistotremastrum niveocremeum HHB9708]KZT43902.1 hypothetical protein SISSUDRAFT_1039826 [Sistotremastrum suecicum HHB10207 ss-3]